MTREFFLLFNMLAPLVVGVCVVRMHHKLEHFFDRVMLWNLLGLTPILSLLAFWGYSIKVTDLSLPLIGLLMQLFPGVVTWVTLRKRIVPRREKGSLIISSLFASRTTVGILSVYVFCGEKGYSLARLVMMTGPVFFYLIGLPLANYFANSEQEKPDLRKLFFDPKMLPVLGLFAGVLLNRYGPARPSQVGTVFPWLIAFNTWCFIVPVGMSLQLKGLGGYWKKALWFIPLRFVAVPVLMVGLCFLFRVPFDAMLVVLLLSLSPVATGAVIVARLYRIDQKMVMAAYLTTVFFYVLVIVPVMLIVLRDAL